MTTVAEKEVSAQTSAEPEKAQEVQVQQQKTPKSAPSHALSPFDEMEHLFERLMSRSLFQPFHWQWPSWRESMAMLENRLPRVDVIERDDEIIVRAEMPGVDKKDVDVSLTDHTVTIRGNTYHEQKEEKGNYYRNEMSRGSFSRTVALPAEVDGAKAKAAAFKDGVLELSLPKTETSKRRSIKVE
jgi:HSP20 family protein